MEGSEKTISLTQAVIYGAIIIAVIIGGSFLYQRHFIESEMPAMVKQAISDMNPDPSKVAKVTSDDHILGNVEAPVTIVVYTDLECPYCKVLHNALEAMKDNYIKDGKVSIVYRNMPLDQLHTKSRTEAIASECAAKLGGNDKYWAYIDKIFAATPSNDGLDLNLLSQFATQVGLDESKFTACTKDSSVAKTIQEQEANGQAAGAEGTPYSIVLLDGEAAGTLPGAVPADQLKKIVDQLTTTEE